VVALGQRLRRFADHISDTVGEDQIPPDLVVKLQPTDIIDIIL
jgi:hypothetical protein